MIEEHINILIIKYLTKEASAKEEAELLDWLSQHESHQQSFRSLKDAYDLGQLENHLKTSDTVIEWKKLLSRIKQSEKPARTISPLYHVVRYVAIFIVGLVCMKMVDIYIMKQRPSPVAKEFITKIETGKGERSKVTLPDSTTVWLNACSSITYNQDFGGQTRKVEMQGEAYFDVCKNISKPFLVCANSLTYRVTGTSFNVYSFDNDNTASLVLVEGSVILEYANYSTEIKPGELIEFNKTTRKIVRQQSNTSLYTNWRFGELMFEKMTFEELAIRLERYFNVTFVFENEKIKRETFGGTFRHYDSLETILKVISTSTPIKYKIEKDVVYIR